MSLMPTYYSSQDPGAPALNGLPGSLTDLLDAILVDGYGSGQTAKPPLGWTREFTAPNKRVYRNNPVSGTGHYLRVDDSASVGNSRHSWVTGFESMATIDDGIGAFPAASIRPNGLIWPKSTLLNSTQRAWFAIGNEVAFYILMDRGGRGISEAPLHFAGDTNSFFPNDSFRFMVSGNLALASDSGMSWETVSRLFSGSMDSTIMTASTADGCFSRSHDGLSQSPFSSSRAESYRGARAFGGSDGAVYPSPSTTGTVSFSWIEQKDGRRSYRAVMPGVLTPTCQAPFDDLQIVTAQEVPSVGSLGPAILAKSFRYGNVDDANNSGQVVFLLEREW